MSAETAPRPALKTVGDARHMIRQAVRQGPLPLDHYGHLYDAFDVPASYLDAWHIMADVYANGVGLTRLDTDPGEAAQIRLQMLTSRLQVYGDSSGSNESLPLADAVGWCLVHAGKSAANGRANIRLWMLISAWPAEMHHAWVYAAAGLAPTEIGTAAADPDGLRVLASLHNIALPADLPDLSSTSPS